MMIFQNIIIEVVSLRFFCLGIYVYWFNVMLNFEKVGVVMILGFQEIDILGVYIFYEVSDFQFLVFSDNKQLWDLIDSVVKLEKFIFIDVVEEKGCFVNGGQINGLKFEFQRENWGVQCSIDSLVVVVGVVLFLWG